MNVQQVLSAQTGGPLKTQVTSGDFPVTSLPHRRSQGATSVFTLCAVSLTSSDCLVAHLEVLPVAPC